MGSSIKVKKSTMVRPAKETPKGSLWLSKIDMIIRTPYSHTNALFFYPPNNNTNKPFDPNIFKEALSKALVPFYPMVGRLIFNDENGRYEIDCNAKGALFIEAESTKALADYGDYLNPNSQLKKLVFPKCDYSGGLSSFPLLLVQITNFKCGSLCLSIQPHHHVADGTSHFHFFNSWAILPRGLDLSVYPVHDRATYLAPRNPPQVKFRHLEYEPSLPPLIPKGLSGEMIMTTECTLKLTKDQVNTLKLQVTSQEVTNYKLSTFEVQAGHVWRNVCMARGLANDQDVKLYIVVNGRSRLKDMRLPKGYFGNIHLYATCLEKEGDIKCKPLRYAASKIHEAIKKFDDIEYIISAIDFLESRPNVMDIVRGSQTSTCPNFAINSWASLPLYEGDFGWGGPIYTSINAIKYEGKSFITPSSDRDGSFSVTLKLFSTHMEAFKEYFYNISSKL
ncbi:anthranilate N-benzoyltransferase protein 2-like [Chenopodium quinoa]|uniref:anthranilate N-benzoyltransferase protein 2-like n=1 Tax=Chenopodium quinoa TaxID=63459 RepID=UPI000B77B02A|nr:anthranilate N-benzoyltransferase protein 2-like [Chenopodium quinoa]